MAARNGAPTVQAKPERTPEPAPPEPILPELEEFTQTAALHWLQWCETRSAQVRWFVRHRNQERRVRVSVANGATAEAATLAEACQSVEDRLQRAASRQGIRVLRQVGGK